MFKDFALDLRVARRKSGLSQADCAHLLGVHTPRISRLESGKALPSLPQISRLSIIYGRTFERLFSAIVADARRDLRERLASMPEAPRKWLPRFNRDNTLRALSDRLNDVTDEEYDIEA